MNDAKSRAMDLCSSGVTRADAGRGALADVAEQARPPGLLRAGVHAVRAAAHRERLEQHVHGVADRPGAARTGRSIWAFGMFRLRVTSTRGIGSPRVIARYGYDLSSLYATLNGGRNSWIQVNSRCSASNSLATTVHSTLLALMHHRAGALVEAAQRREVVVEARAEALRLADVRARGRLASRKR